MQQRLLDTLRGIIDMTCLGKRWPTLFGHDKLAVIYAGVAALAMMAGSAGLTDQVPASPYLIQDPDFFARFVLQCVDLAAVILFALLVSTWSPQQQRWALVLGLIYVGIPTGVLLGLWLAMLFFMGDHASVMEVGQAIVGLVSLVLIAHIFRAALQIKGLYAFGYALLLLIFILVADMGAQYLWLWWGGA